MDAHTKVGGTWKRVAKMHTKVGGTWKEITAGYIKVSGSWKQFFANAQVILSGTSISPNVDNDFVIDPDTATAGWSFNSSGDLTKVSGSSWPQPEWFGSPADTTHSTPDQTYYIRATLDDGSAPDNGPALNTWLALTSTRTWFWQAQGGFDFSRGTLKIEIATDSGGTNIVATGYYRGVADSEI